jgi:hypothetical protein
MVLRAAINMIQSIKLMPPIRLPAELLVYDNLNRSYFSYGWLT